MWRRSLHAISFEIMAEIPEETLLPFNTNIPANGLCPLSAFDVRGDGWSGIFGVFLSAGKSQSRAPQLESGGVTGGGFQRAREPEAKPDRRYELPPLPKMVQRLCRD